MKVEIFHNVAFTNQANTEHEGLHSHPTKLFKHDGETRPQPCGAFCDFCTNCSLRQVQQVELPPSAQYVDSLVLEQVYLAMQNDFADRNLFDGKRIQPEQTRSLSVGDVIVFDEDRAYSVANMGFEPQDAADVRRAVENLARNVERGWLAH